GGRSARQRKNAGPDHRANAQSDQTPDPQRLLQPVFGLFGSREQSIDAFGPEQGIHRLLPPTNHHPPPASVSSANAYAGPSSSSSLASSWTREPRPRRAWAWEPLSCVGRASASSVLLCR